MKRSSRIHCRAALLPDGWANDVELTVGANGQIEDLQSNQSAAPDALQLRFVVPGMPNVHSHAFQRGMAGLAERKGPDSFWSWRDLMYRFVAELSPEDVGVIARQLFSELLTGGFTSLGEFHYLHHQADGTSYDNASELSVQIIEAAIDVGMRICHLPTLYTYAGFDRAPLSGGQLRFANQTEELLAIQHSLATQYKDDPNVTIGLAAHSLRAVSPDQLRELEEYVASGKSDCLHIHIAEQQREVDDCLTANKARPVEYLYDQANVNERWCLIHATHLSDAEVAMIAKSGAVVGACPTTEANLGDGVIRAADLISAAGKFSIGTDSHVGVSAQEELRMLEYSQRLTRQERNVVNRGAAETGEELYTLAATGGAQSLGLPIGAIKIGNYADLVHLDESHPQLAGRTPTQAMSAMVFSAGNQLVCDVIVGGKQVVKEGRHVLKDQPQEKYRRCLEQILSRMG